MVHCNVYVCDLIKYTQMDFDMLSIPGTNKFNIVQVKTNIEMTWLEKICYNPWRLQWDLEVKCEYLYIHNLAKI